MARGSRRWLREVRTRLEADLERVAQVESLLEDLASRWGDLGSGRKPAATVTDIAEKRTWSQSIHLGNSCHYCDKPAENVDHVWPKSRGGTNSKWNCVPSCYKCNGAKADNLPTHNCYRCNLIAFWEGAPPQYLIDAIDEMEAA